MELPELCSCQGETVTRLLLRTAHAVQGGYDAVVVSSEDTDVFGLHLTFSSSIDASLFQKCDTQTCTKLIAISKVVATFGKIFARLSLVFIPSPDVTQLVLLLASP